MTTASCASRTYLADAVGTQTETVVVRGLSVGSRTC